jgi:hypothetical protein
MEMVSEKESWLELRKKWRIVKRTKLEKGVYVLGGKD